MTGFETFESRIIITGKVKLLTALHIGKGQSLEPVGTDLPVVKDFSGFPFIPGSSFKGVLRSHAERIASSLYNSSPDIIKPCFITDDKSNEGCVSTWDEKKVSQAKEKKDFSPKSIGNKLCPVCKLFGSPHFSSKIAIKDLSVDKNIWDAFNHYEKRDGVAIDRGTETAKDGALYDYEVVPAGVQFDLTIVLENPDDLDLGFLYLALRDFEHGKIFIGGGKTKGLGNIGLRYRSIEEVNRSNLAEYLIIGRGTIYEESEDEASKEKIKQVPEERKEVYRVLHKAIEKFGDKEFSGEAINEFRKILENQGINNHKIQEAGIGKNVKALLHKAEDDRFITREGKRYFAVQVTDVSEAEEKKEGMKKLSEYDFAAKIRGFVAYITKEDVAPNTKE